MPNPIYSISVRGRDLGGQHRCLSKEEAQSIYDQLSAAVNSKDDFFEITLGTTVTTARVANIAGFSISVHMEETPEERKARAIARIESDIGYPETACEPHYSNKLIGSSGLI